MVKISEIFYSIQGEGADVGLPTIFVRFARCNRVEEARGCDFCDTKYAWGEGKEMTVKEIIAEVKKYPCYRVCFTGGEPALYQKEIRKIITLLYDNQILHDDFSFSMETNGDLPIIRELCLDAIVISPKDMAHAKQINLTVDQHYESDIILKFVYGKGAWDEVKIKRFLGKLKGLAITLPIYLMALTKNKDDLAEQIKAEKEVVEVCKRNGWIYSPRIQIRCGIK